MPDVASLDQLYRLLVVRRHHLYLVDFLQLDHLGNRLLLPSRRLPLLHLPEQGQDDDAVQLDDAIGDRLAKPRQSREHQDHYLDHLLLRLPLGDDHHHRQDHLNDAVRLSSERNHQGVAVRCKARQQPGRVLEGHQGDDQACANHQEFGGDHEDDDQGGQERNQEFREVRRRDYCYNSCYL